MLDKKNLCVIFRGYVAYHLSRGIVDRYSSFVFFRVNREIARSLKKKKTLRAACLRL